MSSPKSLLTLVLLAHYYKPYILVAYELWVPGVPQVVEVHKNVTAVAFRAHETLVFQFVEIPEASVVKPDL